MSLANGDRTCSIRALARTAGVRLALPASRPPLPEGDFADAVMRCLERDPWQRFQTAKELRGTLESVTFRSTQEQAALHEESSGVHRTIVVLIAAVALLVGIPGRGRDRLSAAVAGRRRAVEPISRA